MIGSFKKYGDAWVGEKEQYQVAARNDKKGWRWVTAYKGKIIRKGTCVPCVVEALNYAIEAANEHFILNITK
jgi:hypothetical protein